MESLIDRIKEEFKKGFSGDLTLGGIENSVIEMVEDCIPEWRPLLKHNYVSNEVIVLRYRDTKQFFGTGVKSLSDMVVMTGHIKPLAKYAFYKFEYLIIPQ